MKSFLALCIIAALGAFSVPVRAGDDPLAPVPVDTNPVTDVDPALWVVKDSDTTIYLFGTIHILKPGLGWFDDGVKSAFEASDTLVLEMVEPSPAEAGAIMADLSIEKSGKKLRDKLGAEDRAAFETALQQVGLPPEALDPLEPWAAAINIYFAGLMQSGYDMTSGVETQLSAAAKAKGKPIVGLETMREQLSIFDQLPDDVQIKYVTETARQLEAITPQTDKLVQLWSTARSDDLAVLMNEGFDQLNLTEALLTRRNANWASWINRRMDSPGIVFMAVGAGHLAGTTSVQSLLHAYGLTAERLAY